jgi:hypothetical protein
VERRWDTDTRGTGVGDARALLPEARRLLSAMDADGWVAEDPAAHLLPHLRAACADGRLPLGLVAAAPEDGGAYVVDVRWSGAPGSWRGARVAAHALLASVAEHATFVRERREDGLLVLEAATGVLDGDGPFAPHGHVVVVRVHGTGGGPAAGPVVP